MFYPRRLFF